MLKLNKIYCGDCLELMKEIPDKCTDLILTDPPYNAKNIGPHNRKYSSGKMQISLREYRKFCKAWFKEARRISKTLVFTPGIANTHNYPQPKWIIAWFKPVAVSYNRMGGFNVWEPIFVYGDTKIVRLPQDLIKINTLNFSKGPEKDHPCPKPIYLWSYLIHLFSKQNNLVGDPFLGSGTTSEICKSCYRNWWGIEINPKYIKIAKKRIKHVQMELLV